MHTFRVDLWARSKANCLELIGSITRMLREFATGSVALQLKSGIPATADRPESNDR